MTAKAAATTAATPLQLLTAEQLADLLQVSTNTLKSWRYHGVGPKWTNVGRSVRYRWTEIDKYLEANTA